MDWRQIGDGILAAGDMGGVILWSLILFALIVGAFWAVVLIKRKVIKGDEDGGPAEGFGLGELRKLHRAGQLTDAEFEKAKASIVIAAKEAAARQPEVLSPEKKAAAEEARLQFKARERESGNSGGN